MGNLRCRANYSSLYEVSVILLLRWPSRRSIVIALFLSCHVDDLNVHVCNLPHLQNKDELLTHGAECHHHHDSCPALQNTCSDDDRHGNIHGEDDTAAASIRPLADAKVLLLHTRIVSHNCDVVMIVL